MASPRSNSRLAGWLVFFLGFVLAVVLVIRRVGDGTATAGDVFLAVVLADQINALVVATADLVGTLSQVVAGARLHEWLLAYRHERAETGRPAPQVLERAISLQGVTLHYPGRTEPVLAELDLDLPAGAVVALVAENGAGKASLVKVLTGLRTPPPARC